ncbi:translation initiation factor IF-2-like [Myiozetetes cayanensis]|uniref:translation initiation factor IF-2-like n=1 Tax=Myiozetetes cayanensis TaxID=478635 RepID=UPI00215EF1D6|nr:translation initiation factor IF-2-like [Myiozetetes cayanensis]
MGPKSHGLSSVSPAGIRAFLKESAQSKHCTKEGLESKKFNSTSCNTVRPFLKSSSEMPKRECRGSVKESSPYDSLKLLPPCPKAAHAGSRRHRTARVPGLCPTAGAGPRELAGPRRRVRPTALPRPSQRPNAAGRGGRTPALTGGGPGAEGGLSAHVRASVPKQSWPASPRHHRPPLTPPRPGSSLADVPPAKRFKGGSFGQRRGARYPSPARRPGKGSDACRIRHRLHQQIAAFPVPAELIPSPPAPFFSSLPRRHRTPGRTGRPGICPEAKPLPCHDRARPRRRADRRPGSERPAPVAKGLPGHSPRIGTGVPQGRGVPGAAAAASSRPKCGRRRRARREQLTAAPPPPQPRPRPAANGRGGAGSPRARAAGEGSVLIQVGAGRESGLVRPQRD